MKVNIFDTNFMPYSDSSTLGKAPREFDYVKEVQDFDGVTLFTDHCFPIAKTVKSKYKIAWQVESPIHSKRQFYPMVRSYADTFDMIFTYDEALIASNPAKYKRCNFGGTTVLAPSLRSFEKCRSVAIVHSGKTDTPNHGMRNEIIKRNVVDSFGRATGRPFDNIADVLAPYNFEIVIENINFPNYFSEKLTDCIACGCIPVYNGCDNIGDYFDVDGMIRFNTLQELGSIIPTLTDKLYYDMRKPHSANLDIVLKDYYTNEDWLYLKYVQDLING